MLPKLKNLLVNILRRSRELAAPISQRRAAIGEIDRLGRQERARLARDLGISTDEIRILAGRGKDAADLLPRRMESIGLDPLKTEAAVMRDLQRCCSVCKDKGLCVHELEDQPRTASWPSYCPNKMTLAALKEERQQARALSVPGKKKHAQST